METETLKELLDKYLQYCLVIRNYSPYTIKSYRDTFKQFFSRTDMKYPSDLNFKNLENYFYTGRSERNWSSNTFRSQLKHLNPFLKWLVKRNYIKENYLKDLEKPRLEHKIPRTLTKEQAMKILEYSFNMSYSYRLCKYRNRAIIGIMLLAGLRKKEVKNIKLNEVSIENKTIFINQGKWGKDRMIPINNKLQLILSEYVQQRKKFGKECIHFFTSIQKDNPIGNHCLDTIIQTIRKRTKINFSAHTLRHAFARLMLEGGCDIYTLSKIMGHAKITTTTIYLSCSNQQMSKGIEMHVLN